MSLYFADLEFFDNPPVLVPVSIGVCTDDGRAYYAISSEYDPADANAWVREHVLPYIERDAETERKSLSVIATELTALVGDDPEPCWWGYQCAYDWVAICNIFGGMNTLPENWPHYMLDLKQWWIQLGRPDIKPPDPENEHHALADAEWNRLFHTVLTRRTDTRSRASRIYARLKMKSV